MNRPNNTLNENQVSFIVEELNKSGIKSKDLRDDLVDHICCAIEEEMTDKPFEKAYKAVLLSLAPNGLDMIKEGTFLLTSKNKLIMKHLLYGSGWFSAFSASLFIIFRMMHWPYSGLLLLISFISIVFIFVPVLFIYINKYKFGSTIDYYKSASGLLFFLLLANAIFFKIMHWPGFGILLLSSFVILNFLFLPLLFFKRSKN